MIDFVHIVTGGADPETVLDEDVRRTADAYDRLNTKDIMQPTFFAEMLISMHGLLVPHSCPLPKISCSKQLNSTCKQGCYLNGNQGLKWRE